MSKKMIAINVLDVLIQFGIFMMLMYFILRFEMLYFYVFVVIVLSIILYSVLKGRKGSAFGKEVEVDVKDDAFMKYHQMIKKAEEIKGSPIKVKYVKTKLLHNPAFYFRGTVYFNLAGVELEPKFHEGVLAHELGHAISDFYYKRSFIAYKFTMFLCNMVVLARQKDIENKKKRKKKYNYKKDELYFFLISLFSYLDSKILLPYLKEEEHIANLNALKLHDGHSLRTYYYRVGMLDKKNTFRFNYRHPGAKDMIDRMEENMELTIYDQDVYHIDDLVYYVSNCSDTYCKEVKKHEYYLHQASKRDFVCEILCHSYFRGVGVKKDIDEAFKYAFMAKELGSKNILYTLGLMYEEQNEYQEALGYFEMAFDSGITHAKRKISRIKRQIELQEKEDQEDED
jgi:hypothetical protein